MQAKGALNFSPAIRIISALLLGVLSGNSGLAARAVVVGAASGAVSGGYEGWR